MEAFEVFWRDGAGFGGRGGHSADEGGEDHGDEGGGLLLRRLCMRRKGQLGGGTGVMYALFVRHIGGRDGGLEVVAGEAARYDVSSLPH